MEKNDHNLIDKNPQIGLMEYIREQESKPATISIRDVLMAPYRPPEINKITCGTDLAEKLQGLLNL